MVMKYAKNKESINQFDSYGLTPLMVAAVHTPQIQTNVKAPSMIMIQELINQGADPNIKTVRV
eukprot:UN27253